LLQKFTSGVISNNKYKIIYNKILKLCNCDDDYGYNYITKDYLKLYMKNITLINIENIKKFLEIIEIKDKHLLK